MSTQLKTAVAYAILCVALIVISFGPLAPWQEALRNGALLAASVIILLVPNKKVTK